MANVPRLSAEARKEAIVEAVQDVFAEKGFDGTTTRELAKAAGVSEALSQETVVGLAGGMRRRGFDVTVGSQLGGPMQGRLEADGVPLVNLPHLVRQVSPVDDARAYREVGR